MFPHPETGASVFTRLRSAVRHLNSHGGWDVVMLSYQEPPSRHVVLTGAVRVSRRTASGAGYLVNNGYLEKLRASHLDAAAKLQQARGNGYQSYALDQNWRTLQTSGRWYLLVPRGGIQGKSWSDIEGKEREQHG